MSDPWYEDGLRFSCTRCGDCCQGPGYVWLTVARAAEIAEHLGLSVEEFGRRYLRTVDGRLALTDRPSGACVFWSEEEGCGVYPARPTQCRTFPFWRRHVKSRRAWEAVVEECPGAGSGRRFSAGEIEDLVDGRGEAE